ncbi:MAG: hypothetical protein ACTSYG_10920 [Candidatus Heimdallarchaeota archaeon]
MKTKTEKELEGEIEKKYKEIDLLIEESRRASHNVFKFLSYDKLIEKLKKEKPK